MSEGTPYDPNQQIGPPPRPPQQPGYPSPPRQPGAGQPIPGAPQAPGMPQPPLAPQHQYPGAPQHQGVPPFSPPPPYTAAPHHLGNGTIGSENKKGMPAWLKLVLIIGLPMLLIGGCVGALFLGAKGEIDRSNEFMAALQIGDYATADSLTDPTCGFVSADIGSFLGESAITGYRISGVQINNGSTSTTGTVTLDQTDVRTLRLSFSDNDLVCGIDIGAFGETE